METNSGLIRYDAMCSAIAACHGVDEAKDIRDKARAIEVYAQQAQNFEAERKACEIRIRAERRAGELLKEMKETGRRDPGAKGIGPSSKKSAIIESSTSTQFKSSLPRLSDLGITKDQSSKWQQLANVPEAEFEKAVKGDGPKPSTEGIINANILKENPQPRIDPIALWLWGRLRDFERDGVLKRDLRELISGMTESMQDDCNRILPRLAEWLREGANDGTNSRAA